MLFLNSRYSTGAFGYARDSRTGDVRLTVFRPPRETITSSYDLYLWQQGDRIDIVAQRYTDAVQWWRLLDVNPEITDPMNIAPGTYIRIPRAS